MPNPLIKPGAANIGKRPQENKRPLAPIPEEYEGDNVPYRGVVNHGVVDTDQEEPLANDWGDAKPVSVKEPKQAEQPIPVRIVQESSTELRMFRTFSGFSGTTGNPPRNLIGRDQERSVVRLKHQTTGEILWVSHSESSCNEREGFPLSSDNELVTTTETPIYVWSDTVDPVRVFVLVEYSARH